MKCVQIYFSITKIIKKRKKETILLKNKFFTYKFLILIKWNKADEKQTI